MADEVKGNRDVNERKVFGAIGLYGGIYGGISHNKDVLDEKILEISKRGCPRFKKPFSHFMCTLNAQNQVEEVEFLTKAFEIKDSHKKIAKDCVEKRLNGEETHIPIWE
mgnify:CR=1 FL=1|jgi:hypothetical protein